MTERKKRELARRLAEGSDVFNFDTALEFVQRRPGEAEKILLMRERSAKRQEEFARLSKQRRQALVEEFG
jgi:hypothetical protein